MEEKVSPEQRRAHFGKAVADALAGRGLKQADLAETLGTTQSTVSAWINGRSEPAAETVFAVEDALDLSPGFLSRLLGYLPLSVVGARPNVEESIALDDELDDASKKMVVGVVRTLKAKQREYLALTAATNGARKGRTTKAAELPQPTKVSRRR